MLCSLAKWSIEEFLCFRCYTYGNLHFIVTRYYYIISVKYFRYDGGNYEQNPKLELKRFLLETFYGDY